MSNKNFILIVLISILGYYLLSFLYPIEKQKDFFFTIASVTPTPRFKTVSDSLAFSPKMFNGLSWANAPSNISAVLQINYQGTIVDIQKGTNPFPVTFRLRASNSEENTFTFDQIKAAKVTVSITKKGNKTPGSLEQLKKGDSLQMHEEIDLKKNFPDAEKQFVITIIE